MTKKRETYTFNTIVQKTVTISIVAKPLTAPVPKIYMINAAKSVVNCASKIVANEVDCPSLTAFWTERPAYSSSLIRSKVMMFASTVMPTPKTSAAMPGSVKTPPMPP